MGDTTSDHDTFVSIEHYACTPQPTPPPMEGQSPNNQRTLTDEELFQNADDCLYPEQSSGNNDASSRTPVQSSPQIDDQSAFMWNLYAPEAADAVGDTDEYEDTLEVPGDVDHTPDLGELCGEFDTSSMKKHRLTRTPKQGSDSQIQDVSASHEKHTHSQVKWEPSPRESLQSGASHGHDLSGDANNTDYTQTNMHEVTPRRVRSSLEQRKEAFVHATNGIISQEIANPFSSTVTHGSFSPAVILHSSLGSLTPEEISFWNGVSQQSTSAQALVFRRLIETIHFQQTQLEDLKAAEIQISSATLQVERRRHSEVEHERSAAIGTLMEQLSEEGEQRAILEEENARLRSEQVDLHSQSEELVHYFKQFDEDFTFSTGIASALKKVHHNFTQTHRRQEEQLQEKQAKLDETEKMMQKVEKTAEERLRKCDELNYHNERLEMELQSFQEGLQDISTARPSLQADLSENHALEKESLQHRIRELEQELDQLKSTMCTSRSEQNKVNDALLSMNVELEDSKRRFNALRKQRDLAERRHRDLMQSSASDRDRFYKFQKEMTVNFADAANEIGDRQNQIHRLQNELNDRERAIQLQASSISHLQLQLQAISDAAVEHNTVNQEENPEEGGQNSLAATVIKSLRSEISKAQLLLQERSDEVEGLKQQIYSKDELLASVQIECTKLRTAASVRRLTSRMSNGPSSRTEQHQTAFLRRLSEKLRSTPEEDGEGLKQLSKNLDLLSAEKVKFEEVKKGLVAEVKQREHALHALRAELGAEIATLKADVRHQETLRIRAQDDCKTLERKYQEILDGRKVSCRESFGDVTCSSLGVRDWSAVDESDRESRRESIFSAIRAEEGVRWKDPIIEEAVRSLDVLIGTKDDLWARNRDLKEKLENILRNMGITGDEGRRLQSLIMQSREFQDELTRIVDMQQDILGNITSSVKDPDNGVTIDDTLPYLQEDLSPRSKQAKAFIERQIANYGDLHDAESRHGTQRTSGEAAQFLREQLNETRALCNEKLRVNIELSGVINELKQEVKYLSSSKSDLEGTLTSVRETHEDFLSRVASLLGAEQSAVAIEDCMRTVMHKVVELNKRFSTQKERENSLTRKVTNLVAQKHVLTHIIDIYLSKYKLDFLAVTSSISSSRQRFRKCVTTIIALRKISLAASVASTAPSVSPEGPFYYDVPPMAFIGRNRTGMISLPSAVTAAEAMPRLEQALMQKHSEVSKLQNSVRDLGRSLELATTSAKSVSPELPTSFQYKEDMMNRKNDMARRLRDIIHEKEELDERLSKEKQARLTAEAKSTRYLEKMSIMKRKLTKTVSNAESKERTYRAAIIYLKGKAEKANDNEGPLEENIDPFSANHPVYEPSYDKPQRKRNSHAEPRAVLAAELENAQAELARLEVGSEEYEKKSRYISGLYGGIQRLGKPVLIDHAAQAAVADSGDQAAC